MSQIDRDIERLIVRRLDGELSEDELLRLDRELIRNPAARRLLEEYSRIDEAAAAAISAALCHDHAVVDPSTLPYTLDRTAGGRRHRAGRWLVPGAAAAAMLAVVLAGFQANWSSGPTIANHNQPSVSDDVAPPDNALPQGGVMRTIGQGGKRIKRDTGREVFGVFGEDGNLYWIEVDRTLTVTRPKRGAAVRLTSEQM